jgi:hypothetical protein
MIRPQIRLGATCKCRRLAGPRFSYVRYGKRENLLDGNVGSFEAMLHGERTLVVSNEGDRLASQDLSRGLRRLLNQRATVCVGAR